MPKAQRVAVTPEEEHLFRRWRANLGCAEELAAEYGISEMKMLGRIAGIWRRLSLDAAAARE